MSRDDQHRDRPDVDGIRGGIWAAAIGALLLVAVSGWAIATDAVTQSCPHGSPLADSGVEGC